MNWKPLAASLALAASFAGCETLSERDRQVLQERKVSAPLYARMLRNRPLALAEIAELSRKGVPPALIVRYVDLTLAEYPLRTEEVLWLRNAGVRSDVIDYLLLTPALRRERELTHERLWRPVHHRPVILHHHHR